MNGNFVVPDGHDFLEIEGFVSTTLQRLNFESMQVPLRYQTSKPVLAGREMEYVQDAIASGWISGQGSYLDRFESAVSRFLQLEEGVAAASGTAALHLALKALGLQPGMEVIVPAFTFVACPNAVAYCGAKPVFADCDRLTRNMTLESIQPALTENTRGVLLVHLFGLPAPAGEISQFCQESGLWLVEDCAQSFGARIGDLPVGHFGDMSIFSFYGNKVISTGEGGMVFAKDPQKRELIRRLRNQGLDPEHHHWHPQMGFNYRMTNIAAAIGCGQIEMAHFHIGERRRIANRYRKNLLPLEEKQILRLPPDPPQLFTVYWLYSLVLNTGGIVKRDYVRDVALKKYGIQTRPFYVPMHQLPMYQCGQRFPHAEFLGDHGIVLPTYSGLREEEIDEICQAFMEILEDDRGMAENLESKSPHSAS